MKLLIGTYTKKDSKGIYGFDLSERLVNRRLLIETRNPTYLDYDKASDAIYAVYQDETGGGVAHFKGEAGTYSLVTAFTEAGSPPCYVRYDKATDRLYDANYHRGLVHVYKNGQLEKVFDYGEGAKAHFVNWDPKTNDLYVCDLGNSRIYKYRDLNLVATYQGDPQMGTRHIAFHPSLNLFYALGELNGHVDVISDQDDHLVCLQSILTTSGEMAASGAAIRISNDGRTLYTSDRGENTITVFSIDENGLLTFIQRIASYGKHPRDFALSKDEAYLVCANMETDNLSLYKRDKKTGLLELIDDSTHCPEPVCVCFID